MVEECRHCGHPACVCDIIAEKRKSDAERFPLTISLRPRLYRAVNNLAIISGRTPSETVNDLLEEIVKDIN